MRISRFLTVAAVALLAGCDAETTAPAVTVDVEAAVNQMVNSGISSYATATTPTPDANTVIAVPPAATGTSGCTYKASNQMFECAPVTVSGIAITRAYQLLDAGSKPLSLADPTAIAAIRVVTDAEGTLLTSTGASTGVTIDRHEDATMSGLRSADRIVNGTATETISWTPSGSPAFVTTSTSTTSNLRLPPPGSSAKWPLGGTITTDRSINDATARYVLTFDGTSVMKFTITTGGHTLNCTRDLAQAGPPATCTS